MRDKERDTATATLTVSGPDETRQVEANAKGAIIGRGRQCDIAIDSIGISREHARIFQDPFGRWIIEDLGSHNGVYVNGQRAKAQAILPCDQIGIGRYSLVLAQSVDQQLTPQASVRTSTELVEDGLRPEVISSVDRTDRALSRPYLKQLNEISERLSELRSFSALYPEVCGCLAQAPRTVAAVLKLPKKTEPLPNSINILARCFGNNTDDSAVRDTANFWLSRRVVEAVRTTGKAVMATSMHSSDTGMILTIVDEHTPRAVICAPLSDVADAMDLLYLDLPVDATTPETFEFVKAVSRQIILTRKMLILMEVKAERSILDDQLSLARRIQSRLTPTGLQDVPGVDLALYYEPAMWVGGDYCDVWRLENGQLAFAIGDVSGKGLPAAMVMSNLQAALRTTMSFRSEPSSVMSLVNLHLIRSLPEGMFVTLLLSLFDPSTGTLEYVNAGHLLPLLIGPGSSVTLLGRPDNIVLGIEDTPFQANVETIRADTGLLVFTDGITEARSPDDDEFGVKGVVNVLKAVRNGSAKDVVDSVTRAVQDFRQSGPQRDDTTVLALFNRGASKAGSA